MLTTQPYQGTPGTGTKRVTWSIYAACAIIFLIFAASVLLILGYSVHQANRFGLATERKLIQRELQREIEEAARYQSTISFWDVTVAETRADRFDEAFVTRNLQQGLWNDYGFSWIVFARADHRVRLSVNGGRVKPPESASGLLARIDDLIDEAEHNYEKVLAPVDDGYRVLMPPSDREVLRAQVPEIHAADIRLIDGRMSIVVVQAVVPQSLDIPARFREPTFMVTVKPISDRMLGLMNERLAISGLRFTPIDHVEEMGAASLPISKASPDGLYVVTWQPNAPGPYILDAALPRALVLALLAAFSMGFVAYRFNLLVGALQKSEQKNRFLAKHDGLTGLANRMAVDEHLQRLATRKGQGFAVMALDLDKFKAVNDRFGHAAGDAVLREIAGRFRARIGERGMVARLGGDEFLVLIDAVQGAEDSLALANALVIDAQLPVEFEGLPLAVGCSAGVALFPDHGGNARSILQAADIALYAAKNGGRNRAVLASLRGILQGAAVS
ncbi:diguanylate cyclase domain-containing protein [Gellertiella hungarica]|uniref:diguanylate cyclase n=1 Tax=Gellertiella hungarica TaxID=1572859 RepID=A0A7W6J4G0_9HYPH|nr:diguanylate cyclase [Gellertiella hungarica]MBB4064587.1 diguanylate cyclase (GGDEF)-like protein [Gellertiella hungarica]